MHTYMDGGKERGREGRKEVKHPSPFSCGEKLRRDEEWRSKHGLSHDE